MSTTIFQDIYNLDNSFLQSVNLKLLPIRKSKLPKDFFCSRQQSCKSKAQQYDERKSTADNSPKIPKTPAFGETKTKRRKLIAASGEKRIAHSARYLEQPQTIQNNQKKSNDDELIKDVIKTSRNIHRVLRKQSLQLRKVNFSEMKDSKNIGQKIPKLPQIFNKKYDSSKRGNNNKIKITPLEF